jgi:hypothetical protein
MTRWSPGETILMQEVWRERVWAARPMTVVADHGDLLALWYPRGTRWKAPTTPPHRRREAARAARFATSLRLCEWAFVDYEWDVDSLWLLSVGEWHDVRVSWLPDGTHWGWYVNLQEPYQRTARGIRTMDLMLDVLVNPDRTWRWKDEDELETLVNEGVFDAPVAQHVREVGLQVAARAERNEPPFSDPWPEWRPDPAWRAPELPPRWDEL